MLPVAETWQDERNTEDDLHESDAIFYPPPGVSDASFFSDAASYNHATPTANIIAHPMIVRPVGSHLMHIVSGYPGLDLNVGAPTFPQHVVCGSSDYYGQGRGSFIDDGYHPQLGGRLPPRSDYVASLPHTAVQQIPSAQLEIRSPMLVVTSPELLNMDNRDEKADKLTNTRPRKRRRPAETHEAALEDMEGSPQLQESTGARDV
jgi:hypothetical protein